MRRSTESATVALRPLPNEEGFVDRDNYEQNDNHVQVLPPVDKGLEAWSFLLASFFIEALLWGFPLSYGVFQDYYSRQPEFAGDNNIAVIGTLSTSIYFIGAPFAMPLVKRFQRFQRYMVIVGWSGCALSLLAASFCTSVKGLIATQGVFYGTSFLMLYFPLLRMLNEWFVERRGFAYGVLYAGGGASGVGLPFLLEMLLSKYGYRTTLQAVAVAQFVLVAPVLRYVKGRLPPSSHAAFRSVDLQFFSNPLFYCFAVSNLFQGFAYYIPSLYLPSFASDLGLSTTMGALILALNNGATVFGQVGFGLLSDRVSNVLILVCVSSLTSAIASFTLWGLASSLETVMVFSLVYGWFAGGYAVFWTKFGSVLSEDPQLPFSLMAFGRGIGNIATGPIAASLTTGSVMAGYGLGKFQPLIIFLGSFMLCSSFGILGYPLKRQPTRF
ncbi:monocarboxylate transporter [Dactylonectria macrodidyma]|uniref:Monocarboxylate transporter n=1 Tax=Dactylonectria macrodidyma TaxID=307937 RepID=A0A9P9FHB7_9HYPO|nr:monocarboxylate transporter [Dactylonectria macrodidyma]